MSNEDDPAKLWLEAKTLDDLGELTARWIGGELSYYPCYGGDPDPETEPFKEILKYFNRNGLVTTFSQPAEALDEETGFAQRACVEGYAREEMAKQLATLGLYTDLLVLIYPPGVIWGYMIPITLSEFHPYTWCGPNYGQEELECFEKDLSGEALMTLASAWKVVIIDLQWGRENYLWEQVHGALMNPPNKPFNVAPSPDLDLDEDFVL